MSDFFRKLENFIFDVFGLIIPGFILILVMNYTRFSGQNAKTNLNF